MLENYKNPREIYTDTSKINDGEGFSIVFINKILLYKLPDN